MFKRRKRINIQAIASAADGQDDPPVRVAGAAYNGGEMSVDGFDRPVVVDLAGLEGLGDKLPLQQDHDARSAAQVGTVEATTDGATLTIAGQLNDTPAAQKIARRLMAGEQISLSIGCSVKRSRDLRAGETARVNGRSITAVDDGLTFVETARLKEVSVVGVGAADNTKLEIAATANKITEGQKMTENQNETAEVTELLTAEGHPELCAQAVRENWTVETAREEILQAMRSARPKVPAGYVRHEHTDGPAGRQVRAAAALLLAGHGDAAERRFDERTLQAASDLRAESGYDLAREALRAAGRPAGSNRGEMLQAAFSTHEMASLVTDSSEAALLDGYRTAADSWRLFARPVAVSDFREGQAVRPELSDAMLAKIGPDGEIKHSKLGESTYTIQAETFARMFSVTRQDLINDGGLGRIFELQRQAGRGAAASLNKAAVLALRDASFYSVPNGNLLTGADSALDIDSLGAAVAAMRSMTDTDGEPVDISPGALVVPPALEATARQILNSTEVGRDDSGGTANPWRALAELVVSPYLSAAQGGSDSAWYLTARPMEAPSLLVALVDGADRPRVEQVDPPANVLGLQFRCYLDYGVAEGDSNGAIKNTGTA